MEPDRMFWNQLERHWRPDDDDLERDALQSVLIHLRRRLPQTEAEHLFGQLPPSIGTLSLEPQTLQQEIEGERPVDTVDAEGFVETVGREVGVPVPVAEQATEAVFAAVKHALPVDETRHVAGLMPTGLRNLWLRA